MTPPTLPRSRLLFLDDDPRRAECFLRRHPHAIWVQTVVECLNCLEEPWDEIHLDHDLGGERSVEFEREDCGMAVIRWIVARPRPHLDSTRFVVHTHNPNAACLMVTHLQVSGFHAEAHPFEAKAYGTRHTRKRFVTIQLGAVLRKVDQLLRRFFF
jgi:Cyclic-phosphate processing Receiver domain